MDPLGTYLAVSTVIGLALVAVVALLPRILRRRGVEMRQTRFGTTLIFDSTDADGTPVRLLNVNGTFQSVSYVPEEYRFELACEYHRVMAAVIEGLAASRARSAREMAASRQLAGSGAAVSGQPAGSAPAPVRVMIMGGGGYSLPKYLAAHTTSRVHTDVVEIDPAVTALARSHFFLDECLEKTGACRQGRLQLVNDDAWGFLRASREPYDVIVNDAFSGRRPLGPMKTAEGARVVREHLSDTGVYLANLRCATEGRTARVIDEVARAFGREFAHVWLVPEWPDEPKRPGCNVLVASNVEVTSLPASARTLQ